MRRLGQALPTLLVGGAMLGSAGGPAQTKSAAGWPEYGGSLEGQRYSAAQKIDRANVSRLQKVWSLDVRPFEAPKPRGPFEATPVLWRGTLYLTTPKDVVLAVDAATGTLRWRFDPGVKDEDVHHIATSRGVA
jgi:quinoprotein glucose dehydrogenase